MRPDPVIDANFTSLGAYGFDLIGPPHPRYPKGYDDVDACYFNEARGLRLVQRGMHGVLLSGFEPGFAIMHWEVNFTKNTPAVAVMGSVMNMLALPAPEKT